MNILLTNDDGIYFEGLWALFQRFSEHHNVTVIAPDRERSAVGHGITLNEPLRAAHVVVNGGYSGYAVSGTPADCVTPVCKSMTWCETTETRHERHQTQAMRCACPYICKYVVCVYTYT